MSFRVASRGSGRVSSRAGFSGSGGAGSMAMSISGSRSASSARGGWWVWGGGEAEAEGGLGLEVEVGLGEAMVDVGWGGCGVVGDLAGTCFSGVGWRIPEEVLWYFWLDPQRLVVAFSLMDGLPRKRTTRRCPLESDRGQPFYAPSPSQSV